MKLCKTFNIKNYKNLSEFFFFYSFSNQDKIHQHIAIGLKRTTLHMALRIEADDHETYVHAAQKLH